MLFLLTMPAVMVQAGPRKVAPHKAAAVATPQVLPATNVTPTSFTANWKAVSGATVYQVTTYEPYDITSDGTYTLLAEDFNRIKLGSFAEPVYDEDFYVDMTEFGWTDNPDWSVLYPVYGGGMLAGVIYTPYIDLTNDGGKFTVKLGITGYGGGEVHITSIGSGEDQEKVVTLTRTGYNEFAVEFTNGTHDTYLTIIDFGIMDDPNGDYLTCIDYLDDFAVEQNLKAGDTYLRLVEMVETPEDEPVTSWDFNNMDFLYGATRLAYDVMAIEVVYTDPDDPWEYDVYYSDYSPLEYVTLNAGITDATVDAAAPVEYFNLQGIRVDNPATGVYIRRQGNATS
ncbi:MAG: hypothetical protein K2M00_03260, partial [Muribaculaceae bacterium]|nr:hypothetical protein [Muribaculaceae bacterium]